MASYNLVVLIGNLTRDPELRHLPSGTAVCEFSVAVNRRWTDKSTDETKEEVSFFDCVCWGRSAEVFAQYMSKGRPVFIEGELRQERWEKDGTRKSRVRINVSKFQFLGGGKSEKQDEPLPAESESQGDPF